MDRRDFLRGSLAAGAAAGLGAATSGVASALPSPVTAAPLVTAGLAPAQAQHVVAISVDGLLSRAITDMPARAIPGLRRMVRWGASTLNARSLVEKATTLPNHTSMVTGRWAQMPFGHGVVYGNDDRGNTVHDAAGEYVASVFDVVHNHGMTTGLYVSKSKFELFNRSWNEVNGALDPSEPGYGRDKIDFFSYGPSSEMTTELLARLTGPTPPGFSFLHIEETDDAGHQDGWMSKPYRQAVRYADSLVTRVLNAVADDPVLRANTVVILVSDHGGYDRGHADPLALRVYRVPFLVWGAGVARGADLYTLSRGARRNPGTAQPPYTIDVDPIRVAEVANLATRLLGLPAVPQSTIGDDQRLFVN